MGHLYEPAKCSLCVHPTKFACDCRECKGQHALCTPCWLEHVDTNTPIPTMKSTPKWKRRPEPRRN